MPEKTRCVINAAEARAEYLKRDYDGSRIRAMKAYEPHFKLPELPSMTDEELKAAVETLRASGSPLASVWPSR